MQTELTRRFGIEHPIVLAPMGGAAGGALATAVSRAGGLGLIGGGYADQAWVRREVALADLAQVGVGFITWHLEPRRHLLSEVLAQRPRAIFLSFGDPGPYIDEIKAAGTTLICQVQTVEDARHASKLGADLIVAQGSEAGGHGAQRGTMALVPAVVDAVSPLPVLAAGGITDGRGIAAALMLGACGAVLGTRFLASKEALLSPRGKARMVETGGDETLRTTIIDVVRGYDWPEPFTGRVLRNDFTRRWHGREAELKRNLPAEKERFQRATVEENFDIAHVFAGEGIDQVRSVEPVEALMQKLLAETQQALEAAARLMP